MTKYFSKKAQIGSTITWFIGFIIIFFILIIFVSFASQIAQKQGLFKKSGSLEISKSYSVEDTRSFINFLNSPVDKINPDFLVKDLILIEGEKANANLEKFKNLADEFIKNKIIIDNKYQKAWIRIYDSSDKVSKDYTGKYDKYSIEESVISGWKIFMSKICDPLVGRYNEYFILNTEKSDCSSFDIKSTDFSVCQELQKAQSSLHKKVVICTE